MSDKRERRVPRSSNEEAAGAAGFAAIGLEAEFVTVVDGVPQKPEDVFGSPRNVVRGPLVHRAGRSYQLPTGGALYFDTGVMEIATPMIEIARGCGARGTRSLWENIGFLRNELDAWETMQGRAVRLVGFSAHYNVSFAASGHSRNDRRSVARLAYLLSHVIAPPVMLLATNRRSTGVGVRPRGNRIEITSDFTPDAALMAATATLIVGIVRDVMRWPDYSLDQLAAHDIPVVRDFIPAPHSSRKGWVANQSCYPFNPFTADVDADRWTLRSGERVTLRETASRTTRRFWPSIRDLGDARSLELILAVMTGRSPSMLDLSERPEAYEDVGRLCAWDDLFPDARLARSRYERVVHHAVAGRRVRIDGTWHLPIGMRGWTHVILRRETDGARHARSLDDLVPHLDNWERTPERRARERAVEIERVRADDRPRTPAATEREVPKPPREADDSQP